MYSVEGNNVEEDDDREGDEASDDAYLENFAGSVIPVVGSSRYNFPLLDTNSIETT